jgi:hypothetical protein
VVWALGMLGLARQPFDTFNAATPILILAIAGPGRYAVQILEALLRGVCGAGHGRAAIAAPRAAAADEAVARSSTRVGPATPAAGGVAIAGFASLVVFEIKSIQVFGLHRRRHRQRPGAGTHAHPGAARHAARPWQPRTRARVHADPLQPGAQRCRLPGGQELGPAACSWWRPWWCSGGRRRQPQHVDNSQKGYFDGNLPAKVEDSRLNERMGGTNTLYVLVSGREDDALKQPAVLRSMQMLQEKFAADPMVGKTLSLAATSCGACIAPCTPTTRPSTPSPTAPT